MGVTGFNTWLVKKFGLSNERPTNVRRYHYDMNALIHEAAQVVYGYGDGMKNYRIPVETREKLKKNGQTLTMDEAINGIFRIIYSELENRNLLHKNLDYAHISVDGVAPGAKLMQQRMRRFSNEVGGDVPNFKSANITPGTDFMRKLDLKFKKLLSKSTEKLFKVTKYSSFRMPGEGEHKILDMIREEGDDKKTIIVSNDSDLVILSLMLPLSELFVSKTYFRKKQEYVDVTKLRKQLREEMKSENSEEETMKDFAILSFFVGNDFLPQPPSMQKYIDGHHRLDDLLKFYSEGDYNFTTDGELDYDKLLPFMEKLKEEESSLLLDEYKSNKKNPLKILGSSVKRGTVTKMGESQETLTLDFKKFRKSWYKHSLGLLGTPVDGFDDRVTEDDIKEMTEKYLEMLGWTFDYYTKGSENINLEMYYNYHFCPLFSDICEVLKNKSPTDFQMHKKIEPYFGFLTPVQQLAAVLPPNLFELIPTNIGDSLDYISVGAYHEEKEGKYVEHTYIPLIPFINLKKIREVAKLKKLRGKIERTAEHPRTPSEVIIKSDKIKREAFLSGGGRGRGGRGRGRGGRGRGGRGRGTIKRNE